MSNNDIVLAIVLAQVSIVALCFFYFLVQGKAVDEALRKAKETLKDEKL